VDEASTNMKRGARLQHEQLALILRGLEASIPPEKLDADDRRRF
jgi:hypothetical protein